MEIAKVNQECRLLKSRGNIPMYTEKSIDELEPINIKIILQGINDEKSLEKITIENSKIEGMGLNKAKFTHCDITQTTFDNCYLRNATFHNVDLTGSKFINCNLEKTKFRICNLNYTEFSKCKLNIDEILENLPTQSNLKLTLLKQLLINQNEMADYKSSDRLLLMIADEERLDWKNKFLAKNSYYNNMKSIDRLFSLYYYIVYSISGFIWGYGLRISRLIRFAIISILLFAFINYTFSLKYIDKINNNSTRSLDLKESIFQSFLAFSNNGFGEYVPVGFLSNALFIVESSFGIIFLGFLVSAFYRRIAR
ncbi:pentapeptide repeat-containing protein [Schinkia azotoformans]|nr:pentapeptide repeat-containing protein [Schinkia azotoformans]MEC1716440.1 pentapeptide repeat-containing protein [Schinkia azotoformans]MEC1747680.1 pentapeptide repeat-containing protein [Schinkia azotoformans]MEC1760352.1 pentapeptide repeat-containing protein [Schinkia azotoformans]MEC1789759.1 pentapeptide repeat-containing protein [Schinkia azotoformans]